MPVITASGGEGEDRELVARLRVGEHDAHAESGGRALALRSRSFRGRGQMFASWSMAAPGALGHCQGGRSGLP